MQTLLLGSLLVQHDVEDIAEEDETESYEKSYIRLCTTGDTDEDQHSGPDDHDEDSKVFQEIHD